MSQGTNDPLRFVSQMFEIAVWPFQAAAKYQAEHQAHVDRHYSVMLLMPALMLFLPLCVLISFVAIAYTFVYVFIAMPVLYVGERMARLFPNAPESGGVVEESNCDK